jgi:SAM-dependent methyltransferase
MWSYLLDEREKRGRRLQALDAGCGPLTWLRYGVLQGLLTVTGVDPLIDVYEIILSRHGLPELRAVQPEHRMAMPLEALPAMAPHLEGHFDFVWSNNALDHMQDPEAAFEAIAFALRRDGVALLQVATNEGTRQSWSQLHKFDIDLIGDSVVAADERGRRVRLVGPGCCLRLQQIQHYDRDGLTVLVRP